MLRTRVVLVLMFVAVFGPPLGAQESSAPIRDNKLLPNGAFQRIGDLRFRVPGLVEGARYVEDGKKLIVKVRGWGTNSGYSQRQFHILDAQDGAETTRHVLDIATNLFGYWSGNSGGLKEGFKFGDSFVSPDGKLLASLRDWPMQSLQVCELQTGKVVFEIKGNQLAFNFVQFSPDSKHVAAIVVDHDENVKKKLQP